MIFTFWISSLLEILVLGLLTFGPRGDKSRKAFAIAPAAESTIRNLVILYFQPSGDEKRERKANWAEVNE